MTKDIFNEHFTTNWQHILIFVSYRNKDLTRSTIYVFILRYVFQPIAYTIWRERNQHRHGENPSTTIRLIKHIDKGVRNRLLPIRKIENYDYVEYLSSDLVQDQPTNAVDIHLLYFAFDVNQKL